MSPSVHKARETKRCGVAVIICALLQSSCTNYSAVPPAEYSRFRNSEEHTYRIVTIDADVYTARHIEVHDSVLVVRELVSAAESEEPKPPLLIQLDKIDRVERIDVDYVLPILLIGGAVGVFIIIQLLTRYGDIST